jgi:hypothetical protein
MNRPDVFEIMGPAYPYNLDKYLLSPWIKKKDKLLYYKRMFLRSLNNCTSIPSKAENSSIKQVDDCVCPTMSILTAAQAMTDKSSHRMLVKEGKSSKSMYSTELWYKSKTSNKITSHGEGLIETEYGLRHSYYSVRVTDKLWWVLDLSHVQELEKYVKIYGSPRFRRVRIVTLRAGGRILCICGYVHRAGKPCRHCYHINDTIESTDYEIIWWESYHYHFGKNIEYTRMAAKIINAKKVGVPYSPKVKHITEPVYKNCGNSFIFEWIMQITTPILVTDPLPVSKSQELASDESSFGYTIQYDPSYSEYDLMENMQYNGTQYSQELKLATSPVDNVYMPYRYHMESYKALINYSQTHPKANDYLKEVMKESIDKMIKFTTESGMVASAKSNDVSKNTPTIKHRLPLVMGVLLLIVSSHQGTQKKKDTAG